MILERLTGRVSSDCHALVMTEKIYRVDVFRHEEDRETWWSGEGGLDESSSGVDFESTPDLAEFVTQVADEVEQHRSRFPDLKVKWLLKGAPADELLKLAQEQGVELP